MRNYLYNILAAILCMASIVSAKAQTLNADVSWDESVAYTPVSIDNVWHIVAAVRFTRTAEVLMILLTLQCPYSFDY